MITEEIKRIIYKSRNSLVKITGLFVCAGILTAIAACGSNRVFYDMDSETASNADSESQAETVEEDGTSVSGAGIEQSKNVNVELEEIDGEQYIVVHLTGAINNPGVYELDINSRIIDGIVKAGGFREDASEDALNLAMPLTDGSKVHVPTVDEMSVLSESDTASVHADNTERFVEESVSTGGGVMAASESEDKININTAGVDRLTTLTGIGESRAKSIIAYREEHGAFKSIEEIMNVSGIKEGSFAKIKDRITVN